MNQTQIAIVRKNQCSFDNIASYVPQLLHKPTNSAGFKESEAKLDDYIWSIISPNIEFVPATDDTLMDIACQAICKPFAEHKPDDFFYQTENSFSTPDYFLEFIHAEPLWPEYIKIKPDSTDISTINNIGCLMSLAHHIIENTCVVIINQYDLSAEKFVTRTDCTKYHLIDIIKRRYFNSAVLLTNDKFVQYYYQNPGFLIKDVFNLTMETDSIQKLSFSFLKYNLVFFFKQDQKKYINKRAIRISANDSFFGDVLVLHELDNNIYTTITIDEMIKLDTLSFGRLQNRKLTPIETKSILDDNSTVPENTPVLWSRYLVVANRLKNADNTHCTKCQKKIDKLHICPICYRTIYCSEKCYQADLFTYHIQECIMPNIK